MTGGSDHGANYFEYTVVKKRDGKLKLMRLGFTAGCFTLWAVLTVVLFGIMSWVAAVFVPISMLLCIILLWFLLRFTSLEYDYEISGGVMSMSVVYGGRSRKLMFKKKISEMTEIGMLDVKEKDKLKSAANVVHECVTSFEQPEIYYLTFTEKGKRTLVFFETTKKGEKLLKFYNSSASKL